MADDGNLKLSTIQEASDVDLSIFLSQLSSVSGEITERALEELLQESEADDIPTKLENAVKLDDEDNAPHSYKKSISVLPIKDNKSVNMFQNAIDSLSEISNQVQEKLQNSKVIQTTKNQRIGNKFTAKAPNNNTSRTIIAFQSSRSSISLAERGGPRSTVVTRGSTQAVRPHTAGPVSLSTIPSRQRTLTAATKLYGKSNVSEPKLNKCKEGLLTSKRTGILSQRKVQSSYNKKEGNNEVPVAGSNAPTVVYGAGKDVLRELWAENNRLNQQIKAIKVQLEKQRPPKILPTKNPLKKTSSASVSNPVQTSGSQTFRKLPNTTKPLEEQLKLFENQLGAITNKYEVKLDDLTRKCEDLEKFQKTTVRKEDSGDLVKKISDACVQTNLSTLAPTTVDNTEDGMKTKEPLATFSLDDLVLEDRTIVVQNKKEDDWNIPKLNLHAKPKENNGASSRRCNKIQHSGDEKRLQAIIRRLNSDMDKLRKENLRLKSQQSSARIRSDRRYKITRTMSTQTTLNQPSVFSPTLTQVSRLLVDENKSMKDRIKLLEEEIAVLKERRLLDLQLLQQKHEEEVELLLEEKLNLSRKLDAVQSWRPW